MFLVVLVDEQPYRRLDARLPVLAGARVEIKPGAESDAGEFEVAAEGV